MSTAVNSSAGFFRLITLSPGQWGDEIRCTLRPYNRLHDRFPPYKALSYVWGRWRRRNPPEIRVSGNKVKVTTNLEIALRHLRKQQEETTLWIDALCIDQKNIEERSLQVAQMREVYRTAGEVIIFLGNVLDYSIAHPHLDEDPRPFKRFGISNADVSLASQCINIWKTSSLKKPVQAFEVFAFLTIVARYGSSSNPLKLIEDIPEAHMTALSEALRRTLLAPWWDRIWVVQEAVVAKNLTVRYSNVAMSWELLVKAANDLSRWEFVYAKYSSSVPANDLKVSNLFSRVSDLNRFRRDWRRSQATDLLSLLRYFGHRKASDDRDRVYALLGLCNEAITVQPDYSLDVTEVYLAPILETIRNTRSLSVLYGDHSRKARQDLPSWVPDWSTELDENERQRAALPPLYDACGGTTPILFTRICSPLELIKEHMNLFLNALKVERDPKRLLREEIELKLRYLNSWLYADPTKKEISSLCEALVGYCHKDGRRDLPTYGAISHSGRSLRAVGLKIGTVTKVTEPLYTSSDVNTAAKVLTEWKRVAMKRPVTSANESFLKTIVSDLKRAPDGPLRRLQAEDTAFLTKWFNEKIAASALREDLHEPNQSVDVEFDQLWKSCGSQQPSELFFPLGNIHMLLLSV